MSHGPFRRAARWALALPLLAAVLLLGGVEGVYRYGLSRVGERPRAPVPRGDFATRALWAAEEEGPLRLEPRWPWTLVADFARAAWDPRHARPSAGSGMCWRVAGQWLAERPGEESARMPRGLPRFALALWLSRHWSAEELLTAHAEHVAFGPGVIGIEAAARAYFGRPPERLALHEAALLAGLPQAPSRYAPRLHPERALQRRDVVLSRLLALGWISEAQEEEARGQPLLP